MNVAAAEVHKKYNFDEVVQCGVSIVGTWQRRRHLFLNGCISVISIDTGEILDIEVLSKMCRLCSEKPENRISHECEKHVGSFGTMEPVGVYRIFERSAQMRKLQYVQFYGDGNSKSFAAVKNVYGEDSVKNLNALAHSKACWLKALKVEAEAKGFGSSWEIN
ncbi:uncharacterized protein TNCV_1438941 [Trichonephila clavipes]|nr:uncharacterized protein TNCV_1438941 [Trichonephila clavipes]